MMRWFFTQVCLLCIIIQNPACVQRCRTSSSQSPGVEKDTVKACAEHSKFPCHCAELLLWKKRKKRCLCWSPRFTSEIIALLFELGHRDCKWNFPSKKKKMPLCVTFNYKFSNQGDSKTWFASCVFVFVCVYACKKWFTSCERSQAGLEVRAVTDCMRIFIYSYTYIQES
jgi:hypothetical protein